MARLDNTRWELMAQGIASGKSAVEAYVLAGYKRNEGNASRLRGNDRIQARVSEIIAEKARNTAVTKESLTKMLVDAYDLAMAKEQAAVAGVLVDRLGRLNGFAFDPLKESNSIPKGQQVPAAAPQPARKDGVVDLEAARAFREAQQKLGGK